MARGSRALPDRRCRFRSVSVSGLVTPRCTPGAPTQARAPEWARKSGAWILEDDYDSEYRYESAPVAALQSLDRESRVLYIGTFSKVLFPALRLGYLVLPEDLVPRFAAVRHAVDICPPTFAQAVLTDLICGGHFARHLRRMRALYRERRSALADALREELGDFLDVRGEEAGMHLVAVLTHGLRDRSIAERAAREGLWTMPLSGCYLGRAAQQGFVLGYGGVSATELRAAVRRLRTLLEST